MRPADIAQKLDVTGQTIRRWTREYADFLGPGATRHGQPRSLSTHDQRVLALIASLRQAGQEKHQIIARLQELKAGDYHDLPPTPEEWTMPDVPAHQAANVAQVIAQNAALSVELQNAQKALSTAQQRVEALEAENVRLVASQTATASELHDVQIELERARGEVQTLTARLDAYTLAYGLGRDRPLPLAAIILVTALVVLVAVLVVFVAARLLVG